MTEYIEIAPKTKGSKELIYLTNGDIIHLGGGIYSGIWFYRDHRSKYTGRLVDAKTLEEALEAYQQRTGNCIVT